MRVLCVGGGHVGLPLSLRFWEAGHEVTLVDIDGEKIDLLHQGRMPFLEQGCEDLVRQAAQSSRFQPLTYDHPQFLPAVQRADYVVMTLGTPLGVDYTFRFDQYFAVLDRLVPYLQPGVCVIVRSTVAPHFTRNVVTARIALGRDWLPGVDFHAAFCPERLAQGQALADIDRLPEIIGADDEETARRATELFRTLDPHKEFQYLTTVEAELAKLYLNTFRYTLFGLANEFALIAEQYGADIYAILQAANTAYPRGGIPRPGPSRGPCLGKDTATLAFSSPTGLIAHAAIKTNENVVLHVAWELRSALRSLATRRITVLGRAFKAGTDDVRDNLTDPLVNLLDREGAHTAIYDPLVARHADPAVLAGSDAVVLMTAHQEFRDWTEEELVRLTGRAREDVFVFDLWNVWPWANQTFGKGSDDHEDTGHRRLGLAHARRGATPA